MFYPLCSIVREGLPTASVCVYHRRRCRVVSDMGWKIGLEKDIGLQVRGGGVSPKKIGQGGVSDHPGGLLIKAFIWPEETISRPQGLKLVGDNGLKSRADQSPGSMTFRQAADKQVHIVDAVLAIGLR